MVQLIAIAGGAGPGIDSAIFCCGVFPLLPLVVFLGALAVYRNSIWPVAVAIVLAAVPYLLLRAMVAGYQPSDDWEVLSDQSDGRMSVRLYLCHLGIAGLAALCVAIRRVAGRLHRR